MQPRTTILVKGLMNCRSSHEISFVIDSSIPGDQAMVNSGIQENYFVDELNVSAFDKKRY